MKLLNKFKARNKDMKKLSALMESSLARSAKVGEPIAGAHHLALGAFDMDDSAARALATVGKAPAEFSDALASLDDDTLAALGIEVPELDPAPVPKSRLGKTDATFEAAIKATYEFHNENDDYRPLLGAHVLAGVATVEHGVAARVFDAMGLERAAVIDACRTEFGA